MNARLIALFLSFQFFNIQAIVKGSNTLPSLEPNFTFPEDVGMLDANEIRGFAWFKDGFSLENSDTDLIYNALFPISGTVNLNGGTLSLQSDLKFQDSVNLIGLGIINGNNHALRLCPSITSFPDNVQEFSNTSIFCEGDLTLNSVITFKGNCLLCGRGNVVTLSEQAAIVIDTNAQLILRDIEIRGIKSNNIRCADTTGKLILDKMQWIQSDSVNFTKGALTFNDQVDLLGSGTFAYSSVSTSTIAINSQLIVHDGMRISIGRDGTPLRDPIEFIDSTSILKLDNCSLVVTSSGLQLTKGTLILDRKVDLDMLASSTQYGLVLGNGNSADDMAVWLTPGCAIWHNQGYFVYNNGTPDKLNSYSATAHLIRNLNSKIFIAQNITIPSLTIELISNLVAPMLVQAGKTVLYENASVILPDVQFEMTAQQLNAYVYSLNTDDQIFFTKGTLPLYVVIGGAGNRLRGNGGVSGTITLLSPTAMVSCSHAFINNTVTFNNGTMALDNDLIALANTSLVGPGTFDLKSNQFSVQVGSLYASTPMRWYADNGTLSLQGKTSLSSTWTVSGKCTIDAHNNRIVLQEGGEIVVDTGSELVLKNAEINGIGDNNIRCLDQTGRITLVNNNCLLDADYSFTVGAIQFYRENYFSGPHTFAYDSPQTSTVKNDALLVLQDDITLSIGRNGGREPLDFESNSSVIKLDNSKLSIKPSGMQLLKGTVVSNRDVEISIASQQESGSLVFGDGTAANDMKFIMNPGSTARFPAGHATFNVTSGDGIKSKSKTAQMIRGSSSIFLLKQNLALADMTIDVDTLSSLIIDPGKTLSYSNGRIVINQGTFELTGIRYSGTTTLLAGNHKIVLENGTLPLATLVAGAGNSIEGNGSVTGPIILQNSLSAVTCGVAGPIMSYISLSGGLLALSSDLYFANNALINSGGRVNMASSNLYLGNANLVWNSDIAWQGVNSSLNLSANVDLTSSWTFSGICTLKGLGNTITLGDQGCLVVDRNSRLCLQNIKIENITDTNICCVDDTSVLILDDVDWKQLYGTAYTFTTGALRFKNKVTMHGGGIFAYESQMTSTIIAESSLKFDTNMTFSYYPSNNNNRLLEMQSDNSHLIFNNSSLCTTMSGIQLMYGRCIFRGECALLNDYTEIIDDGILSKLQGGIIIGAGNQQQDCTCVITGGARVTVVQGKLSYQNVLDSSLVMENGLSILKFLADTIFSFSNNILLGSGKLIFSEKALVQSPDSAQITGSTFIEQEN